MASNMGVGVLLGAGTVVLQFVHGCVSGHGYWQTTGRGYWERLSSSSSRTLEKVWQIWGKARPTLGPNCRTHAYTRLVWRHHRNFHIHHDQRCQDEQPVNKPSAVLLLLCPFRWLAILSGLWEHTERVRVWVHPHTEHRCSETTQAQE